MKRHVSLVTRREMLAALGERYRNAARPAKTRVLDELVTITGYHRKHAIVNFFQPSFKLRSKTRDGARVTKTYFKPATPCERLLNSDRVSETVKESLRKQSCALDPVRLLHGIRELQATLCALAKPPGFEHGQVPTSQSLEAFLATLPRLWRQGEPRPTHRTKPTSPRTYRTRIDPFKDVWPEVGSSL